MSSWANGRAGPSVVGGDLRVPLVGGGTVRYANLDHAASTPALVEVWQAVEAFMPWYASVHRGRGAQVPGGDCSLRGGPGAGARVRQWAT